MGLIKDLVLYLRLNYCDTFHLFFFTLSSIIIFCHRLDMFRLLQHKRFCVAMMVVE